MTATGADGASATVWPEPPPTGDVFLTKPSSTRSSLTKRSRRRKW